MIFARFTHRVAVRRLSAGVPDQNLKRVGTETVLHAAMPCLVEALAGRQRESILGRIEHARWRITWGSQALEAGDLVEWSGTWYVLADVVRDTARPWTPYCTGILVERR